MPDLSDLTPEAPSLPIPPYTLQRVRTLMRPRPGDPNEAEGVLNPASARDKAGRLWLFPRIVARNNFSRIGRALVQQRNGAPFLVRRAGFALEPTETWERNSVTAGVEDPRITTIPELGIHVMTYTAFGPRGPRIAIATSRNLRDWTRLGPVSFSFDSELGSDLNLYDNKDAVFFPEAVPGPDGTPCFAMLHRPCFDVPGMTAAEAGLPRGVTDSRPGIWISYVPVADVVRDATSLTRMSSHRPVAFPLHAWEALKVGAGTPPIRVPEGWLLIYHGVSGSLRDGVSQRQHVAYAAGCLILDPADPSRVTHRSPAPLLSPQTSEERSGVVPNVVFPTAIDPVSPETAYVYYGMADSAIGVARLRRQSPAPRRRSQPIR